MDLQELKNKVNAMPNGTNQSIEYSHEVKLPKALSNHTLVKQVKMTIRIGVAYGNLGQIKSSGHQVQSLPYGQWVKGYENIILNHNNENYLRATKSSMKLSHETTYILDGKVVDKDYLINNGYIKARNDEMLVFNVNIKHITKLGK